MKFDELLAYRKSFDLSMGIFEITKSFPKEERYALTYQIRRSSRSVSANITEAYAKRRYPKHFISKLTDSDGENLETQNWSKYALACGYIQNQFYESLMEESYEVGKLLYYMISNPGKFGSK
ncbi:MAG: four helix bundle protein [Bacteroidota bacterium]